jgi:hypothetical protein
VAVATLSSARQGGFHTREARNSLSEATDYRSGSCGTPNTATALEFVIIGKKISQCLRHQL